MIPITQNKYFRMLFILILSYLIVKHSGLFLLKTSVEKKWNQIFPIELKIGSITYSLLSLSISIKNIRLVDQKKSFFNLDKASISMSYLNVFKRNLVIKSVDIIQPHLLILKKDDVYNLEGIITRLNNNKKLKQKKKEEKKLKLSLPSQIKRINVRGASVTYMEKYAKATFKYVIDRGDILIEDIQFDKSTKSPIIASFRLPKKAACVLKGELASQKGVYQYDGSLNIKELSLAEKKEFFIDHYSFYPLKGVANLKSELHFKGKELKSSHELEISGMDIKSNSGITGMVTGSAGVSLISFLKALDDDRFSLKFRVDHDFSKGKIDMVGLISSVIGSSFRDLAIRKSVGKIEKAPKKILKGIESVIP